MEKLKIKTFGAFAITCGSVTVSETDNRTRKIWKLIKYIAANRNRAVPQSELSELLGCNDTADSGASLKTMLHRARNTLEKLDPECRNLILLKNGSYYWNLSIEQTFDEDIFKDLFEKATSAVSDTARFEAALEMMSVYQGFYLDRAFEDVPSIAESIQRYHKMTLRIYEDVCENLIETGDYVTLRRLSLEAVEVDPYRESSHYYLIKSCIELSMHEEAHLYYKRVNDLFLGKFRINPSDRIRTLYRYIVKEKNLTENNIELIGKDLLLPLAANAPIYCEYDSFRLVCSAMTAAVPKHCKTSGALALFTVEINEDAPRPSPAQMRNVMKQLKTILDASLSSTDIFTRYSVSQYLATFNTKKPGRREALAADVAGAFEAYIGDLPLKLTISFQNPDPC